MFSGHVGLDFEKNSRLVTINSLIAAVATQARTISSWKKIKCNFGDFDW